MRIFTYANPFEINKNSEMWEIVTKHPHFCASDTLVQGLESEYGRESFSILRTISNLINRSFKDYTNNPHNDIKLFLSVSNIIRELPEGNLKTAFRFNIADVVESIKTLILLECDASKFDFNMLDINQRTLLEIYTKILESDYKLSFDRLKELSLDDFFYAMRCTVNDEIEFIAKSTAKDDITFEYSPLQDLSSGYKVLLELIEYYNEKTLVAPSILDGKKYQPILKRLKHIRTLMENEDNSNYKTIIVHGVQKITPIMYFLFKCLKEKGIEIIFLINYASNLPNVYKTWREVYEWCDTKFEYEENLLVPYGNDIGISLAQIIEGEIPKIELKEKIKVFNNLTAFTDREVRTTFKNAKQKLQDMKTQYYAVSGKSSNEILKMYFPEQFEQKPFLSYPIGQFILGIYEMWDFKTDTLKINEKSLVECAVSNLYLSNEKVNLFEVVTKTKLYFSDIETIDDYYKRIDSLELALKIIASNNKYKPLEKLSFFNIKYNELNELKYFLQFIEEISNTIFKESDKTIDFGSHFKSLIDIISNPTVNSKTLSGTEKELISQLTDRLTKSTEGEVVGSIQDVKEALFLYLSGNKNLDTSNWIVRDFEQLDGAVLLRSNKKVSKYHFALLSNANMTKQNNDVISWPLTENMFTGYIEASSAIPIITKGMLERRNFLKFSLFYATFFSKKKIELSYIAEENGEEQRLYYLLDILGLQQEEYQENSITSFNQEIDTPSSQHDFTAISLNSKDRKFFSICPYKFLHKVVIKEDIEYYSEYHIKYFVANFMFAFIRGEYNLQDPKLEEKMQNEFVTLEKLFPFWNKTVFVDIERNAKKQILDSKNRGYKYNAFNQAEHDEKKENFLIAKWTEFDKKSYTEINYMNFEKDNIISLIDNYMKSSQLYPKMSELPHKKVCENCNFVELCLLNYYGAIAEMAGEGE